MDKDWLKVIGQTGTVRLTDEEKKEQQKNLEKYRIETEKCLNERLSFLKEYTTKHGCPCDCPEFESWTTWQPEPNRYSYDPIQNELIANLWQLGCFNDKNPERRNVFFEDTPEYHRLPDAPVVVCSNCGVEWYCYRTDESMMGVWTHYLVKNKP